MFFCIFAKFGKKECFFQKKRFWFHVQQTTLHTLHTLHGWWFLSIINKNKKKSKGVVYEINEEIIKNEKIGV